MTVGTLTSQSVPAAWLGLLPFVRGRNAGKKIATVLMLIVGREVYIFDGTCVLSLNLCVKPEQLVSVRAIGIYHVVPMGPVSMELLPTRWVFLWYSMAPGLK